MSSYHVLLSCLSQMIAGLRLRRRCPGTTVQDQVLIPCPIMSFYHVLLSCLSQMIAGLRDGSFG